MMTFVAGLLSASLWAGAIGPSAQISASALRGDEQLEVTLQCSCTPGDAEIVAYEWDFGLGYRSSEPSLTLTFPAGRYDVHLTVVDAAGMSATAEVQIVVTAGGLEPPYCYGSVSLATNDTTLAGPVTLMWVGEASPGGAAITKMLWYGDEGTKTDGATWTQLDAAAGWHAATFLVEDANGAKCLNRQRIAVLHASSDVPPPRIVSVPSSFGQCEVPYAYSAEGNPVASGMGARTWSVHDSPASLSVDASTGAVTWVPSSEERGLQTFVLRVTTEYGTDEQRIAVDVTCAEEVAFATGCGAAPAPIGGGGASLLWLVLTAAAARARLRRA